MWAQGMECAKELCVQIQTGEKLQRAGTLQDASRLPGLSIFAPASWTAVALYRFSFTVIIFRRAANGRGSSAPKPRRWCLQTEIAASAIRRDSRKRPRGLCFRAEGPDGKNRNPDCECSPYRPYQLSPLCLVVQALLNLEWVCGCFGFLCR